MFSVQFSLQQFPFHFQFEKKNRNDQQSQICRRKIENKKIKSRNKQSFLYLVFPNDTARIYYY